MLVLGGYKVRPSIKYNTVTPEESFLVQQLLLPRVAIITVKIKVSEKPPYV